jgi:hypothetical protein
MRTHLTKEFNMTVLHTLWLPILLSSVFVFLASALIHMALPWHRGDFPKMPDQDKAMDALRPLAIPPGDYMVPGCTSRSERRSPEFAEKLRNGPVMVVTVFPNGPYPMGRSLVLWFVYLAAVSFLAGFAALHALPVGTVCTRVFRLVGVTSFLGYSAAVWHGSIWYGRSWRTALKDTIDGLVYAGITASTFGWFWPR